MGQMIHRVSDHLAQEVTNRGVEARFTMSKVNELAELSSIIGYNQRVYENCRCSQDTEYSLKTSTLLDRSTRAPRRRQHSLFYMYLSTFAIGFIKRIAAERSFSHSIGNSSVSRDHLEFSLVGWRYIKKALSKEIRCEMKWRIRR
jgi:hypothetical protein